MKDRMRVTKIGLLNFWFYDEEEYDFYDGKLLLRGGNGSGKSVTMQSFFPLILDGNKTPIRLDPFGSRDKKIEDYLIGPSDSVQKEESTGYLYMEVYKPKSRKYITIGMGLRARKGRPTDFWGFALQDGRRIGKDFFLYHDHVQKVPFSKLELRARLGIENEFVESQKAYKQMVNRLLFGFPNLDAYDEFINLILQLRSPKLSNGYKPSTLMETLDRVLQPLLEEDLRPLSEAIEEMNKTKEQVELLQSHEKSVSNFMKTYTNYNETILYYKTLQYVESSKKHEEEKQNVEEIKREQENLTLRIQTTQDQIAQLENELEVVKRKKEAMNLTDLNAKVERASHLRELIEKQKSKKETYKKELSIYLDKEVETKKQMEEFQRQIDHLEKEIKNQLKDIKDMADEIYYSDFMIELSSLLEDYQTHIDYNYLQTLLKLYKDQVMQSKNLLEEIEKNKKDLDDLSTEYEKISNQYETYAEKERNIEDCILEQSNFFEENFQKMCENNRILKIDTEDQKKICTYIYHYSLENYELAKEIYFTVAHYYEKEILEESAKEKQKKTNLVLEKKELVEQLEKVQESSEKITYPSEEYEQVESYLKEKKIPYIPFYKAVEFKSSLSPTDRNQLEATLLDMNIAFAFLLRKEDQSKVKDMNFQGSFLFATKEKKENLMRYLEVHIDDTSPLTKQEIEEILKSVGTTEVLTIEPGFYHLDFLRGHSSQKYISKYIGLLAREAERKRKIENLLGQITKCDIELDKIEGTFQKLVEKQNTLEQEKRLFPSNQPFLELIQNKQYYQNQMTYYAEKRSEIEEHIVLYQKEKVNLERKWVEKKKEISFPLELSTLTDILQNIEELIHDISSLCISHQQYLKQLENKNFKEEILTEYQDHISVASLEIREIELELERDQKSLLDIEAILKSDKYVKQSKILVELEESLQRIPKEKEKYLIENIQSIERKKQLVLELEAEEKKCRQDEEKWKLYTSIFEKEYNLHYVYEDDGMSAISKVNQILSDLKEKKNTTPNKVLELYYEAYNKYHLELADYNLNNITLEEDVSLISTQDPTLTSILGEASRKDVVGLYKGKRVGLLELSRILKEAIRETKDLISAQDRHLFEDILLNTVGEKIRDRIASSQEWVAKMNSIMKEMQKDSVLSFQITWKSKEASSEEEMDTKELVRILKMDPKLVSPSDMHKLTNHFRSKINRAEELRDDTSSYYNILFDVLDYRNWFYFQMYYKQRNNDRRELTDRVFSRFSGGEKAKTMYIPMFASVFAKLNGAYVDSLRVVALDEAFAGVDDQNIRELLGIMNSLQLDFIMTSQVLWGDYDVVPELSICELMSDTRSEVVAVRRYKWNGMVKEMLINREEEDVYAVL